MLFYLSILSEDIDAKGAKGPKKQRNIHIGPVSPSHIHIYIYVYRYTPHMYVSCFSIHTFSMANPELVNTNFVSIHCFLICMRNLYLSRRVASRTARHGMGQNVPKRLLDQRLGQGSETRSGLRYSVRSLIEKKT